MTPEAINSSEEDQPGSPGEVPDAIQSAEVSPPEAGVSRARRFGAFVTGGRMDRVHELQSEESSLAETERAHIAIQGVAAEMRRQARRQARKTPRTT